MSDRSGEMHCEHFDAWATVPTQHVGDVDCIELAAVDDPCGETVVYAFDNEDLNGRQRHVLPAVGAVYGYVVYGRALVSSPHGDAALAAGQWFVEPNGCRIEPDRTEVTRVVAIQRTGYVALRAFGGPIEDKGRLRYIDTCSDTLLAPPARLGDPCLNLLHFPPGVEQTFHTHPSVRAGMVARGRGWCETPAGRSPLVRGLVFSIPRDGVHRFITPSDASMDVVAYHPDSDWGPEDEEHPMLNRTWVEGVKIDNTGSEHVADLARTSLDT